MALRGTTAEAYLLRVAEQHQRMGYGQMAYRKEKASRWIAGLYAPSYHTQLAMAALEGIPPEAIHAHGWPGWLLLALPDHTLSTAAQRGFNPEPDVRSPRLTDDEEGGLFGFRFKAAGKA